TAQRPSNPGFVTEIVDFADRSTTNNAFYPDPIVRDAPAVDDGLSFLSEPFSEPIAISGSFSGELRVRISKKDDDLGVELYEVTPEGKYLCLSYFIGRASYARDMSVRRLLVPGKIETIPFTRTRMVSRQLAKGSRLLVVVNVNKHSFAQVNYGTGRDVSTES